MGRRPLTIVSVDPAPAEGRNGSMLDPVGSQDYDSRAGNHADGLRVSFPLAVEGTHSLVSSISHPEEPECQQGNSDGWMTYDGDCQRGPVATQAILTVVTAAPPADAFRPPYSGTDKPLHRAGDVCWSALPKLAPPADTPDPTALLRHVERPWVDHLRTWEIQHGCATLNMYCYGREVGDIVATLAAYVLLDTPDQQELARRLVQLGIDNYGVLQAGGNWDANGGHSNGRKFPIVFAGTLLGDAAMASPGTDIGNEDEMTYYGEGDKALWGRACDDDCYLPNGCQYGGDCDAGAKDCRDPAGLVDGCTDYRDCCTSHRGSARHWRSTPSTRRRPGRTTPSSTTSTAGPPATSTATAGPATTSWRRCGRPTATPRPPSLPALDRHVQKDSLAIAGRTRVRCLPVNFGDTSFATTESAFRDAAHDRGVPVKRGDAPPDLTRTTSSPL
ncbi:hypothetical protein [Nannocystis pusilla]|uniref:hypothetical protein n=1 Tax=Nannocystis pusilla TaxID=889268 RepID=UPI003B780A5D